MTRMERAIGVAEILSAVAVVVTLVFVATELRRNTKAIQSAAFQDLTDASTEYLLSIAADPEVSRIWAAGNRNPAELSAPDSVRYYLLARARWLRMQNVFSQWSKETVSDDDWTFYEGLICGGSSIGSSLQGGLVATWPAHEPVLTRRFVDFVEGCGPYRSSS